MAAVVVVQPMKCRAMQRRTDVVVCRMKCHHDPCLCLRRHTRLHPQHAPCAEHEWHHAPRTCVAAAAVPTATPQPPAAPGPDWLRRLPPSS